MYLSQPVSFFAAIEELNGRIDYLDCLRRLAYSVMSFSQQAMEKTAPDRVTGGFEHSQHLFHLHDAGNVSILRRHRPALHEQAYRLKRWQPCSTA